MHDKPITFFSPLQITPSTLLTSSLRPAHQRFRSYSLNVRLPLIARLQGCQLLFSCVTLPLYLYHLAIIIAWFLIFILRLQPI